MINLELNQNQINQFNENGFLIIDKFIDLEFKNKSFDGFLNWVLDLRKQLDIPHKLSEVIKEQDFDIERLSKMALEDPSTGGNPKKLSVDDIKVMYEHSMSGKLLDRKSTRLNSSHSQQSRMPSSA